MTLCFLNIIRPTALTIVLILPAVRVLAPLPDLGPVHPEQERDGAARQTQKGKQRRRPLVAQTIVHLLREEHDARAPQAADERLGRQCRRRLVLVRVHEVVVGRVVQEDEAEAHGQSAERGPRPRQLRVAGPREDEESDGDEPARQHHGDQSRLGGRFPVVLGHERQVVLVHQRRACGREQDAHGDGDEHEARGARRVALALLVHDRIRDEEHVQQAVQNAHVDGDEKHDELREEQLQRAHHEDAQTLGHRSRVQVLLGDVPGLARGLAQLPGAVGEDGGCVGLGDGEGDEDPDDEGEDELDPVEPAPAGCVREEAANEGSDCSDSVVSRMVAMLRDA